jgi:GNAT superfamily N-acetyltransferase
LTLWIEGKTLFAKHFVEIAHRDDHLKPDFQGVLRAEEAGHVRAFEARKDGELVGYMVFFVQRSLLFQHLEAICNLLFIDPQHRGFGGEFINWCEEQLKAEGMADIFHHVPVRRDFSPLLERKGYKLVDKVFVKKLL